MNTVKMTMKVDEKLKTEADEQFTTSRKMPNEKLLTALEEAENPEKLSGPYDDVKSLMEALRA